MPLSQQAKMGVMMLAGVIDADHQGEIGPALHSGGEEGYTRSAGDPLGHLLVLPHPVFKVSGKLQQPSPRRTTNGQTLQE